MVGIASGDRVSLGPVRVGITVRSILALSFICLAPVVRAQTASRDWQTGAWGAVPVARGQTNLRTHVIDTPDFQFEIQETVESGLQPLAAPKGESVTFAVDGDIVYVREGATAERLLHLVKTTRKLKTYSSVGTGHFIRAVGEGGRTITLEDGSVWETEPGTQYQVAEQWLPLAAVTVHTNDELDGFNYFLDNTDIDRGMIARLAPSAR